MLDIPVCAGEVTLSNWYCIAVSVSDRTIIINCMLCPAALVQEFMQGTPSFPYHTSYRVIVLYLILTNPGIWKVHVF